jgi:hypothetical protein
LADDEAEVEMSARSGLDQSLYWPVKAADVPDAVITAGKAGELDHAIEVAKGEDKKPKRKAA